MTSNHGGMVGGRDFKLLDVDDACANRAAPSRTRCALKLYRPMLEVLKTSFES